MKKIKILLMAFVALFLLAGAVNASDVGDMADSTMLHDYNDLNAGDSISKSGDSVFSSDNDILESDGFSLGSDNGISNELSSDGDILSSNSKSLSSVDDSQVLEAEKDFNGNSFSQLQNEINNSSKDDIIILGNDISQEGSNSILIEKSLTIDGNGHTIDAQERSGIFRIRYANITLRNIVFKNSKNGNFGAIEIYDSHCSIINCSFENNQGYFDGAAISMLSGSLNLSDCIFTNNKAINKDGGAVYSLTDVHMHNCTFINNSASYGGAIYALNSNLSECDFINNSADLGGAIYSKGTALSIEFSQFLDNAASKNGGALFLNSVNKSNISFSSFIGNNASLEGGAIYCNNSSSTIDGSFFINNTAFDAGAIYYLNSTNSMDVCSFENNIAHEDGGAIVFNDSDSTVVNSNFEFNLAGKKGAAIYWALLDKEPQCNISQSSFLNNKAESYSLTGNYSQASLSFMLTGWNNYVNAIYAESAINLSDIEYWNGRISNTDYEFYNFGASGQDIVLEIYDSLDILVSNVTLMTNSFGGQYFSPSDLEDGYYTYNAYHLDNSYYTYAQIKGNFTLSRPASSISLNISDNEAFHYFNCTIPFDIINRTSVRVLITNENGSYVYLNGSIGPNDRSISVYLDSSDEYYNITVFNLPNNLYQKSQDSKLFKILASDSRISINPIEDVAYGGIINVTYVAEFETIVVATLYDENGEKLFSLMPSGGRFSLPILPVGQYNLSIENIGTPNVCKSNDSIAFNVFQADNFVSISANDTVYGDVTTIIIYAGANGNYTLDINGSLVDVEVSRGKGRLEMTLPVGDYYINGTFNNTNYNNLIFNDTFSVSKANNTAFIMVDDAFDGYEAVIRIYSPINGIYLLDVNGTLINVSVFNGIGKATVLLPVGDYYANASFDNPNYNTFITNATFRVEELVYGGANEGNSAGDTNFNVDGPANAGDSASSGSGGSSASSANSGSEGSSTNSASSANDGSSTNSLNYLNSANLGNSAILANAASLTTLADNGGNVLRFSGNKNISMYYFDGTKYTFKVYGDDGKPVGANQIVLVKLNEKAYKLKTNGNGIVSLTIPKTVKAGKYSISASYKGETIENSINVKKILSSKKIVKVKRTAKKLILVAKLKKKLKGKKITFKFRGKKYTAKTNKNGIAKVTVSKKVIEKLKRGKNYKLTITYFEESLNSKVILI